MPEPKPLERTRIFLPAVAILLLCSCFKEGGECDPHFAHDLGMKTRMVDGEGNQSLLRTLVYIFGKGIAYLLLIYICLVHTPVATHS